MINKELKLKRNWEFYEWIKRLFSCFWCKNLNLGMYMPLTKTNLTAMGRTFVAFLHVLAQFLFTANETELDVYHEKVNTQVASWVAKPFMNLEIRKSKENP